MTLITTPSIAARVGLSSRGVLAKLKAAGILPAATVIGLGRYSGGFPVYAVDAPERLQRAGTPHRKTSTASK